MTVQKSRSLKQAVAAQSPSFCVVNTSHISEMYARVDSGLCDPATSNAVALSLTETLGEKVRVFRKHGLALYQSSSGISELPESVYHWLEAVDRGMPAKPFRFEFG